MSSVSNDASQSSGAATPNHSPPNPTSESPEELSSFIDDDFSQEIEIIHKLVLKGQRDQLRLADQSNRVSEAKACASADLDEQDEWSNLRLLADTVIAERHSDQVKETRIKGKDGHQQGNETRGKVKTSAFRGVSLFKRTGRWEAMIWVKNRGQICLGNYAVEEAAARAFDKGVLVLHRKKPKLNFEIKDYDQDVITKWSRMPINEFKKAMQEQSRGSSRQSLVGLKPHATHSLEEAIQVYENIQHLTATNQSKRLIHVEQPPNVSQQATRAKMERPRRTNHNESRHR